MASPKKYETTAKSVMKWAESELEHVGRIAGVHDKDLQYSYALSTVNGMAHLKDAIYELVNDSEYKEHHKDLLKLHATVIRVMKHLVRDYKVDLDTVRAFNTRGVLSNLSYLKSRSQAVPKVTVPKVAVPKAAVPNPLALKPLALKPLVPKPKTLKPAIPKPIKNNTRKANRTGLSFF